MTANYLPANEMSTAITLTIKKVSLGRNWKFGINVGVLTACMSRVEI